jgi:subfamily B ATP-binding cassette protein MsbA
MSPTLRRLMGYYRPHAGALALATALMALASAFPAAVVFLIERVLDDVLIARNSAALAAMPFAIMGLYITNGLVNVWRSWLTRSVALEVVTRLRAELFAHTLRLEPAWHQRTPLGLQLSRLGQDVGNVVYLVSAYATAVQRPLTLVGLLAAALLQDWQLTLVAVILLPLVALPISRFGRRLRRSARARLDNLASLTTSAQQTLSGVRIVQAFRAEDQRLAQFSEENERQRRLTLEAYLAQILPGPVIEAIAAVGVGLAIYYGGQRVFAGTIAPGELIAFLVAMGLMNQPLKALSEINSLTQRALAGAEAAFEVLDTAPKVSGGERTLAPGPCALEFQGVSFDYGEGAVLDGVSFTARPGELVALVGHSGAGKSTLISLVPRFQDPTAGAILLNGVELRAYTLESLRAGVALVTQEAFLFDTTIAENVRLGRPEATDAEVEAACRAANAHDFIAAFPLGYRTRADEGGMRLSGGQRQRICIARALLLDAPILLLDEATSALDRESEEAVQQALARLMEGRTTLAIAHRLSTIQDADRILVMDRGRVVERGRHEELLAAGGEYARLYGGSEG